MTTHKNLNFSNFLCIKSIYDLDSSLLLKEGNIYLLSDEKLDKNVILLLNDKDEIEEYPNFDNAFTFRFKYIV